MTILNLTQHEASADQVTAGVIEPSNKSYVLQLITFGELPSRSILTERAAKLTQVVNDSRCTYAMIGGAPFFMSILESSLKARGVRPVYAFSQRKSVDEKQLDGSLRKVAVFKHLGFYEA